jgi:hypothetical protein
MSFGSASPLRWIFVAWKAWLLFIARKQLRGLGYGKDVEVKAR